jgi:hypothetical protein
MKPKWIVTHAPQLSPRRQESIPPPPKSFVLPPPSYGPPLWQALHERARSHYGDDAEWLAQFEKRIPCGSCRKHWQEMMGLTPQNPDDYFSWTVDRHNEINAKLGKPTLTLDQAAVRWAPK